MLSDDKRISGPRGFFSDGFTVWFRGLFRPLTRGLAVIGITPNTVTYVSGILGLITGVLFASDMVFWGVVAGLAMGFSDIMDGQLAKEYGLESPFGGILDSTFDRYNEFFIFAGLGTRYYLHGQPWMMLACASAFLGSVMISYVKARAEVDGYPCKVGRLQRPERLALLGVSTLLGWPGITGVVIFLAVATHFTAIKRLIHVRRLIQKEHTQS
jgi:phosphatidylglycerophosphate synthase